MESTIKINKCLENDKFCSRSIIENYPLRSFYCDLQDELESRLASTTINLILGKSDEIKENKSSSQDLI